MPTPGHHNLLELTHNMRTIDRINHGLRRAGTHARLYRNLQGGSYYYLGLVDGAPDDAPLIECSIYCYSLQPTDADYNLAAAEINDAFVRAGRTPPLELTTAEE